MVTVARVLFRKLDPIVGNVIDGADVYAVRANHFGVLFDVFDIGHERLLG